MQLSCFQLFYRSLTFVKTLIQQSKPEKKKIEVSKHEVFAVNFDYFAVDKRLRY